MSSPRAIHPSFTPGRPLALATVRCVFLLMVLAAASRPGGVCAQTVAGRVVTGETAEPVRAAWVVLTDTAGEQVAAALTDSLGSFSVRAPRSGTWVVRASQLGYAGGETADLQLVSGQTVSVTLVLQPRALPLDELAVEVERRCDIQPGPGSLAAVLWDEARKGLTAVRWTGRASLVTYRTRQVERTLDLTGRLLTESETIAIRGSDRPFATPDPDSLARYGFVQGGETTDTFYGPDAEVLLSTAFADTHCFRARRGTGDNDGLVGLEFEPSPGRSVPDIRGTLWIDTAAAAVRFVEYRYTGIDYGPRTRDLGGRVEFGRLPSGAWITERWRIRGPMVEQRSVRDAAADRSPRLAGFKETGAEVVEIVRQRGMDAVARAVPQALGAGGDTAAAVVPVPFGRRMAHGLAALTTTVDDLDLPASGASAARVRSRLLDGLTALRRYAATRRRSDYAEALDAFGDARRADRNVAAAHFGEGLTHAYGPELDMADATGYQHRRVIMESAAELSARRAFVRAIEIDPSDVGPAIELAALALATRKGSTIDTADAAIAKVLAAAQSGPALLVAASHVAVANADAERGAALAQAAVDAGGGAVARHALGSALLRIDGRIDEGARTYLLGLESLDEEAAQRYRDDARFIARPEDQHGWSESHPALHGLRLRALWERTAAESAVTVAERLATHMQRLDSAQATFRRQALRGSRPSDALWIDTVATDLPLDARGMIYVRHGAPDQVITSIPDRRGLIGPNATWVYWRGGPPLLFHFMKVAGSSDWELTAGPPCDPVYYRTGASEAGGIASLLSMTNVPGEQEVGHVGPTFNYMEAYERWHADRETVQPGLYAMARRCIAAAQKLDEAIQLAIPSYIQEALAIVEIERRDWLTGRADLTRAATRALTTEEALPVFERPLDILASLYTFRAPDGRTEIVAAILVPSDFTPRSLADGVSYPIRTSLILMDPPHVRVFRVDTLAEYGAPVPVAEGRHVRTYASLSAEPMEEMDFRLAVRNAHRNDEGRVQTGRLTVRDYSTAGLRISDLVIAEPGGGAWVRGDLGLSPIPTHQIAAGRPFRLYYETYNVEEGTALETRIHLERDGRGLFSAIGRLFGGRTEIDLRFDDIAGPPGPFGFQQLRDIAGELEPGTYRIRVTVRNAESGETSERETSLIINPPTGG